MKRQNLLQLSLQQKSSSNKCEKIHALLVICAILSFEIGQNPLKLKALKDEINSYIQITWTSKNTSFNIMCHPVKSVEKSFPRTSQYLCVHDQAQPHFRK